MKAIQIKYLGPTNTKCARLKAFTEAGAITESRMYGLNVDQQAHALAIKYAVKFGWGKKIVGFGCLPNGDYVATIS